MEEVSVMGKQLHSDDLMDESYVSFKVAEVGITQPRKEQ